MTFVQRGRVNETYRICVPAEEHHTQKTGHTGRDPQYVVIVHADPLWLSTDGREPS